jgi:hypothetical protein
MEKLTRAIAIIRRSGIEGEAALPLSHHVNHFDERWLETMVAIEQITGNLCHAA